jgi:tetratricopeptide (TPR) repeat protein
VQRLIILFVLLATCGFGSEGFALDGSKQTVSAPAGAVDPLQQEYQKLLDEDNAAQSDVDDWILENDKFAARGASIPPADMKQKIQKRFAPVRKGYEDFLARHPDHVKARIAYGSFLGDVHDEDGAREQLEKALAFETNNPAVYNNLANIYGHTGPVRKAFEFYSRAIELSPREPVYLQNYATTVYLFRKDASEVYGLTEQQVFNKALGLYRRALDLDPTNFPLASDLAQTYYGIEPRRTDEALVAWTNAFKLARDSVEREGVHLHFARLKIAARRFQETRAHIGSVTNSLYDDLKVRLERNLKEQEAKVALERKESASQ